MKLKHLLLGVLSVAVLTATVGCTPSEQNPGPGKDDKKTAPYADLKVTVEGGDIRGTETVEKDVAIFKGIPYAAAPVGDLRFRSPQPVTSWDGELDCTLWGSCALQNTPNITGGIWTEEFQPDLNPEHYRDGKVFDEDCLYLNVWTSTAVYENKPVLVYIHGGGYNTGGSSAEVFDGTNVAKSDVVYVSINYRLGYLGWMATKALQAENDGAGNYGLLDQIAALKWVKQNIKQFGGNPENITVMGQSAGAGSISGLIGSSKAEGLFQNAVSLSEEPYSQSWQTIETRISKTDGAYSGSSLSSLTAEKLREAPASTFKGRDITPSGPCIDGIVITDTYKGSVKKRAANNVTLMCGNVTLDDFNHISVFTDFYSTSEFTVTENMLGQHNALAKDRAKYSEEKDTYVYMFGRDVPSAPTGSETAKGPQHSYDLYYFLNNFSTKSERNWTQTDYALGNTMFAYLINFCKTGNPNGTGLTEWTANSGNYHYMNFENTAEAKLFDEAKALAVSAIFKL